VLLTIGNQTRD